MEPAITSFTIRILKSLERHKLAPRSRLKNRKSTSKRQGFFHEKKLPVPKKHKGGHWRLKSGTLFSFQKDQKTKRGAFGKTNFFPKETHRPENNLLHFKKGTLD